MKDILFLFYKVINMIWIRFLLYALWGSFDLRKTHALIKNCKQIFWTSCRNPCPNHWPNPAWSLSQSFPKTLPKLLIEPLPEPFPEPLPKAWTHAQTLAQTLPQAFAEREISMFESAHHPIQCSKLPPIIALWTRYFIMGVPGALLQPVSSSDGHPKSMNKLTLNESAMMYYAY